MRRALQDHALREQPAHARPACVEHASGGQDGTYNRGAVAAGDPHPTLRNRSVNEHSLALAHEWKRLGRLATAVALLTSPMLFALLATTLDWAWYWDVLA